MPGSDVIVVGGGAMGCSVAYRLARRGYDVTLFEAREVASEASGASAGGLHQQGKDLRELEMAMRAVAMWPELGDELGADLDVHQDGQLTLVEHEDDYRLLQQRIAAERACGLELQLLDRDELRSLAPGVGDTFFAASYSPGDGHANPIAATRAFAHAARRWGATVLEDSPVTRLTSDSGRVTGVETPDGRYEADWVVNTAGAWASKLCETVGFSVPLEVRGLQMTVTEEMPMALYPVLGSMSHQLSLKQLHNGKYLIGGGWPATLDLDRSTPIGWNRWQSMAGSARAATAVWPLLEQVGVHRVWSGLEAMTPDAIPIIGPVAHIDGLLVAAGFSGHGFVHSPYVGIIIADLIATGESPLPLDDFRLSRFDGES